MSGNCNIALFHQQITPWFMFILYFDFNWMIFRFLMWSAFDHHFLQRKFQGMEDLKKSKQAEAEKIY